MLQRLKKAFTITELVIVIAVIAILAAVLIPTFSSLINKANVSVDEQNVKNINTALQTEKLSGTEINDLEDVKKIIVEYGYKEDIEATGKNCFFVYDYTDNMVYIFDDENNKIIYPEEISLTDGNHAFCRLNEKIISVSDNSALSEAVSNDVFLPTITLECDLTLDSALSAEKMLNLDLNGYTLSIPSFSINSDESVHVYFSDGILQSDTVKVDAENATVIHSEKFTLDASSVQMNVSDNSYHLKGVLKADTLTLSGNTHFVKDSEIAQILLSSESSLIVEGTNVTYTASNGSTSSDIKTALYAENPVVPEVSADNMASASGSVMVTSFEALKAAVSNSNIDKIIIDPSVGSISTSESLIVNRSVSIYGNNTELILETSQGDMQVIYVKNFEASSAPVATKAKVNLYNLKMINNSTGVGSRGLGIRSAFNVEINVVNSYIAAAYYAININQPFAMLDSGYENVKFAENMNDFDLNIDNCVVDGWAAVNSYMLHSSISIKNSQLTGVNHHSGATNSFATIVLDGGLSGNESKIKAYYERLGYSDEYVSFNQFNAVTIENSTIGAYEMTERDQDYLSIQYGADDNIVNLNGVTLVNREPESFYMDPSEGANNKVYWNGSLIEK